MQTPGWIWDLLHLFYPHNCLGCGTDYIYQHELLCARCLRRLPATGFFGREGNPVERMFYGRCHLTYAGAAFYFTKRSLLQHLMVQLKYRGNSDVGYLLGRMMGRALAASGRFDAVDALVPLPLNEKKQFQRGYNQAALLVHGIASVWPRPVLETAVVRNRFTETQTRQNRISRWQNMQEVFLVAEPKAVRNRHLLLVDDVVTTGATLEACAGSMLAIPGCEVSIAAAAYTV